MLKTHSETVTVDGRRKTFTGVPNGVHIVMMDFNTAWEASLNLLSRIFINPEAHKLYEHACHRIAVAMVCAARTVEQGAVSPVDGDDVSEMAVTATLAPLAAAIGLSSEKRYSIILGALDALLLKRAGQMLIDRPDRTPTVYSYGLAIRDKGPDGAKDDAKSLWIREYGSTAAKHPVALKDGADVQ